MILGMSTATYTLLHVVVSFVVLGLATTVATSATGFAFPEPPFAVARGSSASR